MSDPQQEIIWLKAELERLSQDSERLAASLKSSTAALGRISAALQVSRAAPQTLAAQEKSRALERIQSNDVLSYNQKDGAAILGLSYGSLRLEVKRRKIFLTPTFKLLTREEMLRYLREEVQLARKRRIHRKPAQPEAGQTAA